MIRFENERKQNIAKKSYQEMVQTQQNDISFCFCFFFFFILHFRHRLFSLIANDFVYCFFFRRLFCLAPTRTQCRYHLINLSKFRFYRFVNFVKSFLFFLYSNYLIPSVSFAGAMLSRGAVISFFLCFQMMWSFAVVSNQPRIIIWTDQTVDNIMHSAYGNGCAKIFLKKTRA